MTTPQPSRLISAAAKAALQSLGCVQKGRSRIWLDDRSLWVGVVEFQPSSWATGSYLNVGACWLWLEKDYLSFDAGYRIDGFNAFQGDEPFAEVAKRLAERARDEVEALRKRFSSPSHVQAWITRKGPISIRDHYHLAVSAGLATDWDQSARSFADVMSDPEDRPWAADIKRRAAELMQYAELGGRFEREVMETVRRSRQRLGLPVGRDGPAEHHA